MKTIKYLFIFFTLVVLVQFGLGFMFGLAGGNPEDMAGSLLSTVVIVSWIVAGGLTRLISTREQKHGGL